MIALRCAAEAAGERDPRRNGLDAQSRPRALPLSTNLLRLSTLALSQIVSQSTRHLQSAVLPGLAQSVQSLRDLAGQSSPDGQQIAVSVSWSPSPATTDKMDFLRCCTPSCLP